MVFVKPPQSLKTILNYPCLKILGQQFPANFLDPKKSSVFWSGAFLKLRFRRDRLKPFGNNAPPRHWKACQPRETPVDGLEQFISWYSVGSWSKLVVSTNPFKKYARQIGFIFPTFRGWKFPKMFEVATTQFMMFGYKNFPETNMAPENRPLGIFGCYVSFREGISRRMTYLSNPLVFVNGPRFGFFNHMFSQQKHRSLAAPSRPGWTKSFRFRVEKFTISLGFKDGTPTWKVLVVKWRVGGGSLVLWIRFRCWSISPKRIRRTVTLNTSIFSPLGDQQKQGIQEKTNFSQSYSAFFDDNPFSAKKIPSQMLSGEKNKKHPRKNTHL